jgi:multidrug efflux pump subunit AcrB
LRRVIQFFVERHLLVNVIIVAIAAIGILTLQRLPMESFPVFDLPILSVRAQLPGASARDIETKITIPIEEAIQEIDHVETYQSDIADNVSVTIVELFMDTSDQAIRDAERSLRSEIDAISDFPVEMVDEPVIERMNRGRFPILQIALSGPDALLPETAEKLSERIQQLKNIAEVNIVGLPDPEARILVDPDRALEHGVTLLDVARAIKQRNVSNTGGILESDAERRQVVMWSRLREPEDVGQVVLRFRPDGGAVRVSDIARVEITREDTSLIAHTDGQRGVSLVVRKQDTADIVQAELDTLGILDEFRLPEGVHASIVGDEAFYARNRLAVLGTNGLIGLILVASTVFLFLSPGAAFWVCVGVPVVMLGAVIVMPLFGITLNAISTAAFVIVIGMLVDDAVVVAEKILALRQVGTAAKEAAIRGAESVLRPVTASAITTGLAFAPLFAMGGMPGKVTWYIPAVVLIALAFSLFESFTLLPAHMTMVRDGSTVAPKRKFILDLEATYSRVLGTILEHRIRVILIFAGVFIVVAAFAIPRTGLTLFPQSDAQAIFLKVRAPLGTPLEKTEAVVTNIEGQIAGIMGGDLLATTGRIGHSETTEGADREFGISENEAVVTMHLIPHNRQNSPSDWVEIVKRELQAPENIDLVFQVQIMGPPVGRAVTLHVAGSDDRMRRTTAASLSRWLENRAEVVDIEIDERPGIRQIDLNVDPDRLALRGLDAQSVGRTLQAAFYGIKASDHRGLEETTDFRVLLEPSARRSLDALLDTPVRNQTGDLVQLRDVVNPVETSAVSRIFHRNGKRTATVTAEIAAGAGENAESFAKIMEAELLPRFQDREGTTVYLGGEAVKTRETTQDVRSVAIMAFLGIGVVIALMLGSFIEAAFVMTVVPFALLGVILVFVLHGQDLSLFAVIGTVGLAGVVVNASIVMVDAVHQRLNSLPESASSDTRREALIEALTGRLRPVIVTTLSTLGGVLPLAYGLGGYDAVMSPMSLALGWGLLLSTPVTLILVPCLYTTANALRHRRSKNRIGA